jgi:deoxyribonuclease IV
MPFGAHMSIAGGLHHAFARGQQSGCDTIQVFTKNASQWAAKPLLETDVGAFCTAWGGCSIKPVLAHDSYLINMGTPADELWAKSRDAFRHELERTDMLGIEYLVTHAGAHMGGGVESGIRRIAQAVNEIQRERSANRADGSPATMILFETTAGQGSGLCYRFDEMARLFELLDEPERVGVCFDTCHVFAAGYDMRTPETYAATMAEFDQLLGLDKLCAFHLNDSLKDVGCRVDRHAHIGQGYLGLSFFHLLVNDPRFADRPMILETNKGEEMVEDMENLAVLRALVGRKADDLAEVQALADQTGKALAAEKAEYKAKKKANSVKAMANEDGAEV